jgi:hypothetical protein
MRRAARFAHSLPDTRRFNDALKGAEIALLPLGIMLRYAAAADRAALEVAVLRGGALCWAQAGYEGGEVRVARVLGAEQ